MVVLLLIVCTDVFDCAVGVMVTVVGGGDWVYWF